VDVRLPHADQFVISLPSDTGVKKPLERLIRLRNVFII
jgi:hypothetical protein